MAGRRKIVFVAVTCLYLVTSATSQAQTAGRLTGTVKDPQGAVIVGAEVSVENPGAADRYSAQSDGSGNYSILQVSPASYDVKISAAGFKTELIHAVTVGLAETTTLNGILQVAQTSAAVTVIDAAAPVRSDSPEISVPINSRSIEALPLPTRNFLQLLTLAPGVGAPLTNNSAIGRNSPNVSVNGSRVTQNGYEINGVDASDMSLHSFADVAVPAPESVGEVNVQTSLYDASVAGGGGSVQVITKSGSNALHGGAYEYFRNEALNANDVNLKTAGVPRPRMRRNVYGVMFGGPAVKNKVFFFASYQGSREANGATDQSLYKNVLIAPGLTDDRSASTLITAFGVPSVDPIALRLLNQKLPNGQFLIPTPQTADGLVTGTALSTYHEEQFNTNFDYRPASQNAWAAKFFFAHAPLFSALAGSNFGAPSSLPGFGTEINVENRVLSLQETHIFNAATVNEIRFGYNFIRHDEVPQESLDDSSIGIRRSSAGQYPGLPLIVFAKDAGGGSVGTSDITYQGTMPSLSVSDTVSLQRGRHYIRAGGEIRRVEWRARAAVYSYGEIDFPTFYDFLIGNTGVSQSPGGDSGSGFAHLGTGLHDRDTVATDYHLFLEDGWKISSRLTLNLGLRYELDMPPYDSRGRIGGFDPELYRPNLQVDGNGFPIGPPAAGIIEAGNALPEYSLPGVTRVGKRILHSVDPNNLGPRIGLAWSPLASGRLAVRAGYGIFYARPSFSYLALQYFAPPFFLDSDTSGQPFSDPFAMAPPDNSFPLIQPGSSITGQLIDRSARTPCIQQFTASLQFEIFPRTTLQVAYAGSRGVRLFRSVFANQARIASLDHPITNAVTGAVITSNTNENASLRAPMQGVSTAFFTLNESTAQSSYHSLQTTLKRQASHGLQFTASYTLSKSIDNTSNPGGGANSDGSLDRSGGLDTGFAFGNVGSSRANRGLSDFDRKHSFTFDCVWDVPPLFSHGFVGRAVLSNWQLSGIVTAMSGLPVDIFDPIGGSLYGLLGARPNWSPGADRRSAMRNVASGYYFDPTAFTEAIVPAGHAIPSAHDPTALAGDLGTDIGNVGRNILRGSAQSNTDLSIGRRFPLSESKTLEFRGDLFNILNHGNRDNPVSKIGSGEFGKVLSFSPSPRIVQFALKVTF